MFWAVCTHLAACVLTFDLPSFSSPQPSPSSLFPVARGGCFSCVSQVDAANAALGELLKANSGAAKLVAVSASDSIADIVTALAEADALGMQGEAAYANAVARKVPRCTRPSCFFFKVFFFFCFFFLFPSSFPPSPSSPSSSSSSLARSCWFGGHAVGVLASFFLWSPAL